MADPEMPAESLLPEERTFWRLVGHALLIGLAAGAAALAFVVVVEVGTDLWFPEDVDYGFGGGEIWWIGITTVAGLVVGLLRAWPAVPERPAGTFDSIQSARIDYRTAPQLVLVSAVSLVGGASLGPFDAGARSGGAIGEWFSQWRKLPEEMRRVNALSGTNGGIGALLTAPFIATLLIMELVRPSGRRYYGLLVPNLVAATAGFFVFYSTVGETFLDIFSAPGYDVEAWHFGAAVILGAIGAVLAMVLGLSIRALRKATGVMNPVARATLGGVVLGVIGVLVPLAMFSGKQQLADAVEQAAVLGGGVLVVAVLAKIFLMATSLATGFIGGPVMPTLAIGGLAGLAAHIIVPELPLALSLSALLVAVPGATLQAPFAAIALAALTVGIGPVEVAPAGFAVVTSYLLTSRVQAFMGRQNAPG